MGKHELFSHISKHEFMQLYNFLIYNSNPSKSKVVQWCLEHLEISHEFLVFQAIEIMTLDKGSKTCTPIFCMKRLNEILTELEEKEDDISITKICIIRCYMHSVLSSIGILTPYNETKEKNKVERNKILDNDNIKIDTWLIENIL
jgi:hypothetical protein